MLRRYDSRSTLGQLPLGLGSTTQQAITGQAKVWQAKCIMALAMLYNQSSIIIVLENFTEDDRRRPLIISLRPIGLVGVREGKDRENLRSGF